MMPFVRSISGLSADLDVGLNVPKRGLSFEGDPTQQPSDNVSTKKEDVTKILSHWDTELDVVTRIMVIFAGNSDWIAHCPLFAIRAGFRVISALGVGITPWMTSVTDHKIHAKDGHTTRLRVYTPKEMQTIPGANDGDADAAVGVLFIHGGGGWLGSIETHDSVARRLANRTRFLTASVDYRLVPEHTYLNALDDVEAGYHWLIENLPSLYGSSRARPEVVICGDSAGGMYAAGVCVSLEMQRKAAPPGSVLPPRPLLQVPIYPCVDAFGSYPSRDRLASGWLLSKKLMHLGLSHWIGRGSTATVEAMKHDPRLSVGKAPASILKTVAPALLMTAEFDPLHDEGVEFCESLTSAGNEAHHTEARGMLHGFLGFMGFAPAARREAYRIFDALRRTSIRLIQNQPRTAGW